MTEKSHLQNKLASQGRNNTVLRGLGVSVKRKDGNVEMNMTFYRLLYMPRGFLARIV